MTKTPLTKEQIKHLSEGSVAKHIVNKFVDKKTVNWARDCKCAKKLYKMFPNPFFWNSLPTAQFQAMPQMLTPQSIQYLEKQYRLFKLEIPDEKQYILEERKVGEDYLINEED